MKGEAQPPKRYLWVKKDLVWDDVKLVNLKFTKRNEPLVRVSNEAGVAFPVRLFGIEVVVGVPDPKLLEEWGVDTKLLQECGVKCGRDLTDEVDVTLFRNPFLGPRKILEVIGDSDSAAYGNMFFKPEESST